MHLHSNRQIHSLCFYDEYHALFINLKRAKMKRRYNNNCHSCFAPYARYNSALFCAMQSWFADRVWDVNEARRLYRSQFDFVYYDWMCGERVHAHSVVWLVCVCLRAHIKLCSLINCTLMCEPIKIVGNACKCKRNNLNNNGTLKLNGSSMLLVW